MQHHVHVRTAITHVNQTIVSDGQLGPKLIENGHFSVSGGKPKKGLNFPRFRMVLEPRPKDVIRGNDSFKC